MSMQSRCCAIIPARGGSKGIPAKNLAPVAGKPLLAHSIRAAQNANRIDRVIVSTDDAKIAATATSCGAEVVERPAPLATDSATSESAVLHVLDVLRAAGTAPELVAFLQCTSPLTAPSDIDGTLAVLDDSAFSTAVAVTEFHYFLWSADERGSAAAINHDKAARLRRQDRDPQYLETGAVYAMRAKGFWQAQHRFFGKTGLYVMPAERVWEIDDPFDLRVAGLLMQRSRSDALPRPVEALVMDFDGVHTDGTVMMDQAGVEAIRCDRRDGLGLELLRHAGVPMIVLSKERNQVVAARCRKLGIECVQSLNAKAATLEAWAESQGARREHVVYIGDDVNDLECIRWAGCGVAPANAHHSVLVEADIVLEGRGGQGALRELADLILTDMETP